MDFLKDKWYLIIGGLVVLLFLAKNRNATQITQIGGGQDVSALAAIASNERESDENRKFGLISTLLDYDIGLKKLTSETNLANKSLDQQIDLAKISGESQKAAFENQLRLAQLSYNSQQAIANQQNALQRYYYEKAFGQQRRNDWLGAIGGGLQSIIPLIFGNSTNGGGINFPTTPPIFGGSGWNF